MYWLFVDVQKWETNTSRSNTRYCYTANCSVLGSVIVSLCTNVENISRTENSSLLRRHASPFKTGPFHLDKKKLIKQVMIQIMMAREQMVNLKCFNYLGSLIKNGARHTFIYRFAIAKETLSKNIKLSTRKLDFYLTKELKAC